MHNLFSLVELHVDFCIGAHAAENLGMANMRSSHIKALVLAAGLGRDCEFPKWNFHLVGCQCFAESESSATLNPKP